MSDWAVILAGGVGSRLWPLSRSDRPKQCLPLDDTGRTLLRATVERIGFGDRVLVVTGPAMVDAVRSAIPEVPADRILVEPSGRNTAPPIAWAAWEVRRRGGTGMAVFPSDHRVTDEPASRTVVTDALEAARRHEALVLLGQQPTRPETGFGYIVPATERDRVGERPFLDVDRFVEKPPAAVAEALIDAGALWNSGMFVWTVETILTAARAALPGVARALDGLDAGASIEAVWDHMEAISVDHGVLERSDRRLVTPASFGWSDLGRWAEVAEGLAEGALGRARVLEGVAIDGGEHRIYAPDRLVVTVGVEGLLVVDTPDALLICARDRLDALDGLVARLRAAGLGRFT